MDTNKFIGLLKEGHVTVSKYFLRHYRELSLTDSEFIFMMFLISEGDVIKFDPNRIAKEINVTQTNVLELIHSLTEKNILAFIFEKNEKKIMEEFITLEPFYNKILSHILGNKVEATKDTSDKTSMVIFEKFEQEFGRTLSPMEFEIINGWFDDGFANEVILEALREAILSGVTNLRYIDKILLEWSKKGLKTADAINKYTSKYRKDPINEKELELFSYNWLDDKNE